MEKSVTYLEKSDGGLVEAELWDDIPVDYLNAWKEKWRPYVNKCKERLQNAGTPQSNWPQDLHWDWDEKFDLTNGLLAFQRFSITCESELQGLMIVDLTKTSRVECQKGKHLAYIEYVSTAPWNRPDMTEKPRFRKIGTVMLRAAVQLSQNEGFAGRLGLHSLRQSEAFYRRCGMSELGPDSNYYKLAYFEMTESQATAFIA